MIEHGLHGYTSSEEKANYLLQRDIFQNAAI